jgi:hypothetical protein
MSHFSKTPVTFTRDEARKIRELLGTPDARIACPRCNETLELKGPIAGDGKLSPIYQVSCTPCHRSAIITETPGSRRPAE